jgi:hypothetical protein
MRTLFFLIALCAFLISCKKDKRIPESDVQPVTDAPATGYRELPVTGFTGKYDSLPSFRVSPRFLGCNNDNIFGRTEVGLYTNAVLNLSAVYFGDAPVPVSAELDISLEPLQFSGISDAALTYSVYTLDSILDPTRFYFTRNFRLYNRNDLIGVYTGTADVVQSATPLLRIPLSIDFAKRIMSHPEYLQDNATFQSVYRGFYIRASVPSGSEGIVYQCRMDDPASALVISYRPTPADTVSTLALPFSGSGSMNFNTVLNDPQNGSDIFRDQLNGDSIRGKDMFFVKGLGIAKIKLKIPDLVADTAIRVISRAEMTLFVDRSLSSGSGLYRKPYALTLLPVDSLGREILLTDLQSSTIDLPRYDGLYNPDIDGYTFNLARHVQAIISGKVKNYGFRLIATQPISPFLARDDMFEGAAFKGSASGITLKISYVSLGK